MLLHISLFGGTRLRVEGGETVDLGGLGTKPRQLFEILALNAGRVTAKEALADLLWEGRPPPSYGAGLESYVSVLRRRLGLGGGRCSVLATADNGYALDTTRCEVDVLTLQGLADRASRASFAEVLRLSQDASRLASGRLLPHEAYATWAVDARRDADRLLATLLGHGAQGALALGLPEEARPLAEAAVGYEPRYEEAWQHLMRAQWFSGATNEALRTYGRLRGMLVDELGQEPTHETTQVYLSILSHSDQRAPGNDPRSEVRLLLTLLRQALDGVPGLRTPARDDDLSHVAARLLAGR